MADSTPQRETMYKYARKHLGKPYKYGAKPSEAPRAFDCSSFVQYLYRRIGINLPRVSIDQAAMGRVIRHREEDLAVGDLIFIKGSWGRYNPDFPQGIGHVAMYVGGGMVINAKYQKNPDGSDGGSVIEESVDTFLNRPDLTVIKRIL